VIALFALVLVPVLVPLWWECVVVEVLQNEGAEGRGESISKVQSPHRRANVT